VRMFAENCKHVFAFFGALEQIGEMNLWGSKSYTRTHIHTHIHTYIHTYIPTYIHTFIHSFIRTYIHTYIHTHIHIHICHHRGWFSVIANAESQAFHYLFYHRTRNHQVALLQ